MARQRNPEKSTSSKTPSQKAKISSTWLKTFIALLAVVGLGLLTQKFLQPPTRSQSGVDLGKLPGGASPNQLSLLLVTLDTTRADRIGAYGFDDIETPNLDRLAREGVLFEQAESVAPLTLPAHSSIFTGQFPPAHGVRDNGGFYLGEDHVVLAEVLRDAGWRTGGFVGSFVLDSKWGIAQGFDRYFDDFELRKTTGRSLGEIERPAAEVVDAALSWLDEEPQSRFFGWVHFYDPHSPYKPPGAWGERYSQRPYVGEIAYVDHQLGRLLTWLEENDRMGNTVVVVIGDHGESLGEHGESGHGFFIYESATRVPFIIRTPFETTKGRTVGTVVRAVDVRPTALDLLGIDDPAPGAGSSLVSLLTGAQTSMQLVAYSEAIYPKYHYGWSDLVALRAGDMKYIAAPRPELYDLASDPQETINLIPERQDLAERMRRRLLELEATWKGMATSLPQKEVDPDTRARLEALGYLGGFAAVEGEETERWELPDPKDKIHLYNLMRRAREASLGEGGPEAAIQALQQVLEEDSAVIDAWVRLGNEQRRLGRIEDSIASYKEALRLQPESDLAVINLANAYRAAGADEEAILGFEQFLRLDPRSEQVRYELAQMLIDRNELEKADEQLREALAVAPEMAAAQNARGVIALRRRDLSAAENLIREALEIKPDVRLAHFNLAVIAEGRGEGASAVELYRRELELYPESYKVEFNLGRLLGARGDLAGQTAAFERSIVINPEFAEGHFFLAKAYLDQGIQLDRAEELARTGLEYEASPGMAPMGHYLLADIYTRLGRPEDAEKELAAARSMENLGS